MTATHLDYETLTYHQNWHDTDSIEQSHTMLEPDGFCDCCGVDYSGVNRDDQVHENEGQPLTPQPWSPRPNAQGRVDFDTDDGTTVATVSLTYTGDGYQLHLTPQSDLDEIIVTEADE